MTERTATTIATLALAAAGAAAAYFVLRDPKMRRLAWNLARTAATTTLPAYVAGEVQSAWAESGR